MMQRVGGRGSLGNQLLILVVGSALVGLGTSAYVFYQQLYRAARDEVSQAVTTQALQIEQQLIAVRQAADTVAVGAPFLQSAKVVSPDAYARLVQTAFERHPRVLALGLSQEPKRFIPTSGSFSVNFVRSQEGITFTDEVGQPLPGNDQVRRGARVNYASQPFYTFAREVSSDTGRGIWTEPYSDYGTPVITYGVAARSSSGAVLGVATADVRVANLNESVRSSPLADNQGHFIILSNADRVLLYPPDPSKADGGEQGFQELPELRDIWDGMRGKVEDIQESAGSIVAYRQVSENKWAVFAVVPQAAILGRVLPITIAATAGVGILLLVVVVWFVRSLNARLKPILESCDRLTQERGGDLQEGALGDEIDRLNLSFKNMIAQIALNEERIRDEVSRSVQAQERLALTQQSQRESELVEQDVGDLLDVVTSMEDGDLTIAAEVSDRATGLVADTLNRLREKFTETIARVLATAQDVALGAQELEKMARTVALNTVEQAQSVDEGRSLTQQVASLAQNSAEQVNITNQALQEVQATVASGRVAINQLIEGITVLQTGSAQIVQRMKTLGEFVGLAEQFVQDQTQIASLTQVLAINATLVAARAAEQRDPKQFIGVAREFETIAGQVNDLATQTNDGLTILRQRTGQIQTVVSAIDAEVQNLGSLVAGFTSGVEKSQDAFQSVQAVTEQVVLVGQKVSESSVEIVHAADSTAKYMSEIAELAELTADLTRSTRLQSEQMGNLAQQLLSRIQFFRLPAAALPESKPALAAKK
ncbi:MAG: methyl-accepting chemotaxis protein [Oscillatoriales cyanobacterium SM2_2_1]|nr:methyl-accepting chemotaxis protein [Oscillatoriales cyanobacterium SM2_2_1]